MLVQRNHIEAERHRAEARDAAETNPLLMEKLVNMARAGTDRGVILEMYRLAQSKTAE